MHLLKIHRWKNITYSRNVTISSKSKGGEEDDAVFPLAPGQAGTYIGLINHGKIHKDICVGTP